MMPVDPGGLWASIERLEKSRASGGVEPPELLQQVVIAADELFLMSGTGLMLMDAGGTLRYVTASNEPVRHLESAQEEVGEGPCIDSYVQDVVVMTPDVCVDERWPRLAPLLAPHGICAVLGAPVSLGGSAVGTLNLYRDRPHDWDDSEAGAIQAYCRTVEAILATVVAAEQRGRLADQLQYALDYRVLIERGIGYLMAQHGIDSVAAFDRLRNAARSSRRKVGDVAKDVLDGRGLD
ncbi:MAG: GAF and ANTAR domain-containing protein [Acidimicrobiales bacterium]